MDFQNSSFNDILDDLASRFIINLPTEELASAERIYFQIEQAHWFYEDFIREEIPSLPCFSLKNFAQKLLQRCPLLQQWATIHDQAFSDFMQYKVRVPVCGAIILNENLDKCLLVKGWSSRSGWGFPKGKINKDEPEYECAIREVFEETGFLITPYLQQDRFLDTTISEQYIRLYIIPFVPDDTHFEPQTRKEISRIEWHSLNMFPMYRKNNKKHVSRIFKNEYGSYYLVSPFLSQLYQWVSKTKKKKKLLSNANDAYTESCTSDVNDNSFSYQQQTTATMFPNTNVTRVEIPVDISELFTNQDTNPSHTQEYPILNILQRQDQASSHASTPTTFHPRPATLPQSSQMAVELKSMLGLLPTDIDDKSENQIKVASSKTREHQRQFSSSKRAKSTNKRGKNVTATFSPKMILKRPSPAIYESEAISPAQKVEEHSQTAMNLEKNMVVIPSPLFTPFKFKVSSIVNPMKKVLG